MRNLNTRVTALESMTPTEDQGRPFLWTQGRPLADALADAGLTLDDKPLFAIRLEGVRPGDEEPRVDPIYERDKHLVD
ncbi:MAG: hypothetical protein M0R03_06045 [Novosphingobium sp.]|nr:hypothetical protein [Novosphingobium sp.]